MHVILLHSVWRICRRSSGGPFTAGGVILLIGFIGLVAHQPWLFPSLGPSVYLQIERPELQSSRFYNTLAGHFLGMGTAFLVVMLVGAAGEPSVLSTGELTEARVWASAIAIALSLLLMMLLRASHPPAAATVLLITLGGFTLTAKDASTLAVGIIIIATLGEGFRQLRLKGKQQLL